MRESRHREGASQVRSESRPAEKVFLAAESPSRREEPTAQVRADLQEHERGLPEQRSSAMVAGRAVRIHVMVRYRDPDIAKNPQSPLAEFRLHM